MTNVAQVGGDHYDSSYKHWDWIVDIKMPYLPGNATKYVARWRKKSGLQDLLKAKSYIEKMISTYPISFDFNFNPSYKVRACTERFIEVNKLDGLEAQFMWCLCGKRKMWNLKDAMNVLASMITIAKGQMVSAEQAVLASVAAPAGRAGQAGATTIAGQGQTPAPALPYGAGQGAMGQAPATNGTTAEQISQSKALTGMEHPFGYDGED